MKGSLLAAGSFGLFIFFGANSLALGDNTPSQHLCFKPERPLFLAGRTYRQKYIDDSITYENCLQNFIRRQLQAINVHNNAIKRAMADLDNFSRENQ